MKTRTIIAAAALLVAAGCISIVGGGDDDEYRRAETYPASYDVTWRAVLQSFADLDLPIATVERESGLVATDWILVSEADDRMDCPDDARQAEMRFNVLVEEAGSGTRMTITSGARALTDDGVLQRCTSTGALERAIQRRVSRKVSG